MSDKKPTKAAGTQVAAQNKKKSVKAGAVKAAPATPQLSKGLRITATVTGLIVGVTYLMMVFTAFTSSLIPGKYLGFGFLVSSIATAALMYLLIWQKAHKKFIIYALVLAIVGIAINLSVYTAGRTANSFVTALATHDGNSYEEYAIVALKKDSIKLATVGQSIAVLSANDTADIRSAIAEKTPAALATSATPTQSILNLQQHTVQMALFTTAYMRELQATNNNEIFQQLEILGTIRVKVATKTATADVTKPFVLYISGIDTYGDVSKTSRSDVNILVAVNPKTHQVLLVNTPRDYYVQLNGTTGTKDKLTHAGIYGVDTSVKTLQDLYNIGINYNIRINFTSLEKLVDAMGGVDVQSEYNFSSGGFNFVTGTNHVNGTQTLAFSRERHSFEGGDRTRGQNQMKVITAIIAKMTQPSNALKAGELVAALQGVFETNMASSDITALIRNQLDTMAKWTVTSTSVDGTGSSQPTYSMGAQRLYVMIPDEASLNSARQQLKATLQ